MKFSQALFAAISALAIQAAEITNTAEDFVDVTAGEPFTITWSGADSGVTLLLKNGPAADLQTVQTIGSGLTGNSYTWTPSVSLVNGDYAFEIDAPDQDPNYSITWTLTGGAASSSSSVASSTTASSSASSSASSTSGSTTTTSETTLTTSTASTTTASTSSNSTSSTASKTSTTTTTGTSSSTSSSASATASGSSGASGVASPLAFVLMTFAAMVFLN